MRTQVHTTRWGEGNRRGVLRAGPQAAYAASRCGPLEPPFPYVPPQSRPQSREKQHFLMPIHNVLQSAEGDCLRLPEIACLPGMRMAPPHLFVARVHHSHYNPIGTIVNVGIVPANGLIKIVLSESKSSSLGYRNSDPPAALLVFRADPFSPARRTERPI